MMARRLSEMVGIAPEMAQWDKFGYLAGFDRHVEQGAAHFQIHLIEDRGEVFSKVGEIDAFLANG